MASKGYVNALLNPLADEIKKVLGPIFDHVLDTNRIGSATKAANFQWFKVSGTTSSNANEEFSILHGMESAPTWFLPVIDLVSTGTSFVPLTVTNVDSKRIYLTSPSTGASFVAFVE